MWFYINHSLEMEKTTVKSISLPEFQVLASVSQYKKKAYPMNGTLGLVSKDLWYLFVSHTIKQTILDAGKAAFVIAITPA